MNVMTPQQSQKDDSTKAFALAAVAALITILSRNELSTDWVTSVPLTLVRTLTAYSNNDKVSILFETDIIQYSGEMLVTNIMQMYW